VVLYARKRSPRSGNLHTRKKTRETRGESVIKYSIWSRMASTLLGGGKEACNPAKEDAI
jgi:hypothetical protein